MSQQWTAGKITTEMFPQPRHLIPGKSRKAQCLEGAHGQDGGWDWGWQEWDEGPYTDFLGCWRMHVWNTSYSRVCDKGLCSFQALQRPSRVSTFCSTPIESSLLGCGHWREELCPQLLCAEAPAQGCTWSSPAPQTTEESYASHHFCMSHLPALPWLAGTGLSGPDCSLSKSNICPNN